MSTITKLNYLADTKDELKDKLNEHGANITDNDTFRSYVDKIKGIYNNWPKVTVEGTEIALTPTRKGRMNIGLKGNTEQAQYTGKNLYRTNRGQTNGGITFTKLSNSSARISGTATSTNPQLTTNSNSLNLPAGQYTFSISHALPFKIYLHISLSNNTYKNIFLDAGNTSITDTVDDTINNWNLRSVFEVGQTVDEEIKIQLEQGETATEWEEYNGGHQSPTPDYPQPIHVVTGNNTISIGNTNYPINLGSIELCKIGDYQDYIYKENGNWYKYNAINKLILTENANVNSISFGTNSYELYVPPNSFMPAIESKIMVISNKYKGIPYNKRADEIPNSIYGTYRQDNIHFRNTQFETVEDFKTNNIGTIIYVILKTPTTTQITDETLIAQLDAIENAMSTTGTTTITQTNSDLPFIISVSALKKGGN